MNLAEFIRQLGADPASQDPEFLRARDSAPEFVAAAKESARFEQRLGRALALPVAESLLAELKETIRTAPAMSAPWRYYAMAASVLLAVAAAGITWRMNTMEFDSIGQYVAYHYNHDGASLLVRAEAKQAVNIEEILSDFQVELAPDLAAMVSLIKFCPTPNGMGAHLVLNTASGPITVIFMPDSVVTDGEMLAFDGMQAQLVRLARGSAAVIGSQNQDVARFHSLVQSAFVSHGAKA
jgi:hypothetical protein